MDNVSNVSCFSELFMLLGDDFFMLAVPAALASETRRNKVEINLKQRFVCNLRVVLWALVRLELIVILPFVYFQTMNHIF